MNIIKSLCIATLLMTSTTSTNILATPPDLDQKILEIEQEKQSENIYKAHFPNLDIARKASITFHNQLMESHLEEGYLILELSTEEKEKLTKFGFKFEFATEFIKKRNARLDNLLQQLNAPANNKSGSIKSIPGRECYETVEETLVAAQKIVTENPNLAEYIDIGNSWEKTQGLGGYDLKVLKLTNQSTSGEKPILFINSAIHAREYTTAPLTLAFAHWLIAGYGINADATWLLDTQEVHMLLQSNPDGRKKAEGGSFWRKNTNQNHCGATSNDRGVDLNRNFSSRWNITNGQGSSGIACRSDYRGPSAGSEPEVHAIESYLRSIWPDRRGPNDNDAASADTTGIHLDIHSYSELVLWPWGDKRQTAPNGSALQTLGRKFAFFNGYYPQQSIGLYPTDGTSDSISYGELGVPGFTFELGTKFFQDCYTYNTRIKPDNLKALIYAAKASRAPYILPSGSDITDLNLSNGASTDGVQAGTQVTLTASSSDERFSESNGIEPTQTITAAEYYIDVPPWKTGANPVMINASDGTFDEKTEKLTGTIDTSDLPVGKHTVYVRAKDSSGAWGTVTAAFLVITDTPPNLSANISYLCDRLACRFDASNSSGNISSYSWNYGDQNTGTGSITSHTYANAANYQVTLIVSDGTTSDSKSIDIDVSDTPPASIFITLTPGSFITSWVDVDWTGTDASQVDIYRDGALVITTNNDGEHRDYVSKGSYTYRVCDTGSTTVCSDNVDIYFLNERK